MEKDKYTFIDFALDVLNKYNGSPLSVSEIWDKGQKDFREKLHTNGKTPERTLSTNLFVEVTKPNGRIKQVSANPARFLAKDDIVSEQKIEEYVEKEEVKESRKQYSFLERDLHQLLVNFVHNDTHFRCHAKTISEKDCSKGPKGKSEWLNPDIVGIQYSFDGYSEEILQLQGHLEESRTRLFSFELKRELSFANIRECYFQAVSNSSWANEGYLVALIISKENDFLQELRRLSAAFGIGVIKLNAQNVAESEILCTARENNIDWTTIDILCKRNDGFKSFIKDIDDAITVKRAIIGNFDKVLDDDELEKYIAEKHIVDK